MIPFRPSHRASLLTVALCLCGCLQGPDFQAPPLPRDTTLPQAPEKTEETPVPGGQSQLFVTVQDLPDQWWHLFASSELDGLIRLALDNNPDVRSAEAALRQANENVEAGSGALFPQVSGSVSGSRERQGPGVPNAKTNVYNAFNASLSVSYLLDIFGAQRRSVEALAAQADYQRYQLAGTYLTLTTTIVTTVLQIAALQDEIEATGDIISNEQRQLELVQDQFAVGSAAKAEVFAARAQLQATQASLPRLQKQLETSRHALAALIGKGVEKALPEKLSLSQFTLPGELPLSLPSALVRQRPDILAQEALLHVASAQIGVAMANQLPQITLTGNFGSQSPHLGDAIGPDGLFAGLAGGLVQPLFDAGQREAASDAARAAYDAALEQYRGTVIHAFQNVADCLSALQSDAQALKSTYGAMVDSRDSVDLTEDRLAAGTVAYAELLLQQQQYQQARISYLSTLASRYSDTAMLFQALGGGWWHETRPGGGMTGEPAASEPAGQAQPR